MKEKKVGSRGIFLQILYEYNAINRIPVHVFEHALVILEPGLYLMANMLMNYPIMHFLVPQNFGNLDSSSFNKLGQ